jgi:L-serine/L-threonine ammonia-lyase
VHLIAASGGNAGLAAACASNAFHVRCTVFLPAWATQSTIDVLKRQKAEVKVVGLHYAEALKAAQAAVDAEENA